MKLLSLFTILIFTSCETSKISEEPFIIEVLNHYIEEDSLYRTNHISSRLLSYTYYETQYTKDSLQIPLPTEPFTEYQNEINMIETIANHEYFSSKDADHLKHQLKRSREVSKSVKFSTLSSLNLEMKEAKLSYGYFFYVPIFNLDSSAVYVQYDCHNNLYGDGNGALLIKDNGKWKKAEWFTRWMR